VKIFVSSRDVNGSNAYNMFFMFMRKRTTRSKAQVNKNQTHKPSRTKKKKTQTNGTKKKNRKHEIQKPKAIGNPKQNIQPNNKRKKKERGLAAIFFSFP